MAQTSERSTQGAHVSDRVISIRDAIAGRQEVRAESTTFDRALDRACGSRAITGNNVRLITDADVFDAIREQLTSARSVVHFENYIIRNDKAGREVAALLGEAAGRGVKVRLIYDGLGSRRTPRAYWEKLRKSGVEVRGLSLSLLHPVRSFRRDHRKYVGVDGRTALVGGFCIGDEWLGDAERNRLPWRDTAAEIIGPAAAALDVAFAKGWNYLGSPPGEDISFIPADPRGEASVRVIEGLPQRMRTYRAVELLVAGVATRLWITDAYLVAPAPMFAALIAAARDGVDVRVLVPGATDIPAVRALTRIGYRELLAAGVRIWEWRGPMLHAKTVIGDDRWLKVGSSNLNVPSLLTNYELDVLVDDIALAGEAIARFRHDISEATEIVLRPRRGPERLTRRLPPAVAPTEKIARGQVGAHARSRKEVSQRAVIALRKVAEGARRSIAGAVIFLSLGIGALFLLAPRVMAAVVAAVSFWIAARATAAFFARRKE